MLALGVLALALVASACSSSGGSGASGATTPAKLVHITYSTSFPIAASPINCVYYLGESLGFFKKYGLDAEIGQTSGSTVLIGEVAAGRTNFGISVSTESVLQAVDKGAAVKIIGVLQDKSTNAVISRESSGISKPADLKGKKVAYSATGFGSLALKLFLTQNDLSASDMTVVNLQPTEYAAALKAGQIDAYVSNPTTAIPNLEKIGVTPRAMLMADFGASIEPNLVFISSDAYIKSNPAQVKAFLAGMYDTWKYAMDKPDAPAKAGQACVDAHVSAVDPELAAKQIDVTKSEIGAQYKEKDFQKVDLAELEATIQLLNKAGGLPNPKPAADYFTNAFLPTR